MRSPFTLHPTPSWSTVLEEQFRSVGIVIRRVVTVSGVLFLVISTLVIIEALRNGGTTSLTPQLIPLVTLIAPFFALAVWREDYRFPHSYLAAMPVNRTGHALAKVAVGWAWLMVLVATFLFGVLIIAVLTGGQIGVDEVRLLMSERPSSRLLTDVDTFTRPWTTPSWQWAVFFTSTTVTYLIGSAVVLASNRTRWWLAGLTVLCLFLIIAADNEVMHLGPAMPWFERVILGPYGLKTLITGYDGTITVLTTTAGEDVQVWSNLPRVEAWVITVLLWLSLGSACVVAVVSYDRKD